MNCKMNYLIVPGFGGSKIYCNCNKKPKRLYPNLFFDLNEHFFEPHACQTFVKPLRKVCGIPIYNRLEHRLKNNTKDRVDYFAYDWRKEPLFCAKKLKTLLYTKYSEKERKSLVLIGHSNGGLIIRILFEYLKFSTNNVASIILCATPLFGSFEFESFSREYDIYNVLCKNIKDGYGKFTLLTAHDLDRIFKCFKTTLIYYIPSSILLSKTTESIYKLLGVGNVEITDVYLVQQIHRQLSKFSILSKCLMVFNISKKMHQKISFDLYDAKFILQNEIRSFPKISYMKNKGRGKSCDTQLSLNCFGDGVVCLPKNILPCVIYDSSHLPHSLIMNSKFVHSEIIKFLSK